LYLHGIICTIALLCCTMKEEYLQILEIKIYGEFSYRIVYSTRDTP
jgi:hypothetical protein